MLLLSDDASFLPFLKCFSIGGKHLFSASSTTSMPPVTFGFPFRELARAVSPFPQASKLSLATVGHLASAQTCLSCTYPGTNSTISALELIFWTRFVHNSALSQRQLSCLEKQNLCHYDRAPSEQSFHIAIGQLRWPISQTAAPLYYRGQPQLPDSYDQHRLSSAHVSHLSPAREDGCIEGDSFFTKTKQQRTF